MMNAYPVSASRFNFFPLWGKPLRDLYLRWLMVALAACAFHIGLPIGVAQNTQEVLATETAVKAAFLYKFIGYVGLPPASAGNPGTPFVIGVAGAEEIAAELARLTAGRTIDNRPIEIRQLKESESINGIQMLFAAGTDSTRLTRLLRSAQQRAILAVTDANDALDLGSVINFRLVDGRVRFEVSLLNAEKGGLKLSSRMLGVAWRVEKGGQ